MLRSMLRLVAPSVALALVLPVGAQAASLLEAQMNRKLQSVATESNKDLPREIDEKTLEVAYTVEGMQLIDHLSVLPDRAEQMRANPKAVYFQLGRSVCTNPGYRELMAKTENIPASLSVAKGGVTYNVSPMAKTALNAFVTLDEAGALTAARQADARRRGGAVACGLWAAAR